jgi:hypothetical protein
MFPFFAGRAYSPARSPWDACGNRKAMGAVAMGVFKAGA